MENTQYQFRDNITRLPSWPGFSANPEQHPSGELLAKKPVAAGPQCVLKMLTWTAPFDPLPD